MDPPYAETICECANGAAIGSHTIGRLNCSCRRFHLPGISYYQLRLTKSRLSWVINTGGLMETVIQRSLTLPMPGVVQRRASRWHTLQKAHPVSIHSLIIGCEHYGATGRYKSSVFNYLPFHVYELKRNYTRPAIVFSRDFASSTMLLFRQWRYENDIAGRFGYTVNYGHICNELLSLCSFLKVIP